MVGMSARFGNPPLSDTLCSGLVCVNRSLTHVFIINLCSLMDRLKFKMTVN